MFGSVPWRGDCQSLLRLMLGLPARLRRRPGDPGQLRLWVSWSKWPKGRPYAEVSLHRDAKSSPSSKSTTPLQELGLSQAPSVASPVARSVAQYRIRRSNDPHMIERLKAIAAERRRFVYRRLRLMLRREGIVANHKRVYRIYRDLALQLRPRRKRGVRYVRGNDVPIVTNPNELVDRLRSRSSEHGPCFSRANRCR